MNGLIKLIHCLILLASAAVLLPACGGGGGGDDEDRATITGTVAGTMIIAFDANGNQVASTTAARTIPKSFSLSVPVGGVYKFYFIESENTEDEEVFSLYAGTTNLFLINSETTVDLGFVDTTSGVAVPTNNPLDVAGVSSSGEDSALPPSLSFAGTYTAIREYDDNISDGVDVIESDDLSIELIRQDTTHLSVTLSDGTGSLSVPLVRSGSVARIASALDTGSGYLLELIVLSDGANMAFMLIGQEYSKPADISFTFANWQRESETVTADDFVGEWSAAYYGNPYLQSSGSVFTESSETLTINKVDDNRVSAEFRGDTLNLDIVDGRASLAGAPVTLGDTIFHSFTVRTDGQGLTFYDVETALNTATSVSVGLGLATK